MASAEGAVRWWRPAEPLCYAPQVRDGMHLLAHDPAGAGRIVEVLGDLPRATSEAVVVPGNAHNLGNYRSATGGASPRHNGHRLQQALQQIAPSSDTAVVVWLGYRCPRGFITGARRRHALRGAMDLRRLIAYLPAGARITLAGHSYVCATSLASCSGGQRR